MRIHVFISGRVQGVRYRETCRKKAEEIGVYGWVRNLQDGRVEAVFEGGKEKVCELVEWARKGPFFARVDALETAEEECKDEFKSFEITG